MDDNTFPLDLTLIEIIEMMSENKQTVVVQITDDGEQVGAVTVIFGEIHRDFTIAAVPPPRMN